MDKKSLLKKIAEGKLKLSDIPKPGPGFWLIQTGPSTFTDAMTGENFTSDQVATLTRGKGSIVSEIEIVGSKEGLSYFEDFHPKAARPYLIECRVNEIDCFKFLTINIPELKAENIVEIM